MNKEKIKETAIIMARESGLINLSRAALCERVGIPDGSFPHVMGCNFTDLLDELRAELPNNHSHAVSKKRVDPSLRRESILSAALELAKTLGYNNVKRSDIAHKAGVAESLVSSYFGTMPKLKRTLMRAAVSQGVHEVVAQGLANGDKHASKAPMELKALAATHLANQ